MPVVMAEQRTNEQKTYSNTTIPPQRPRPPCIVLSLYMGTYKTYKVQGQHEKPQCVTAREQEDGNH
ncbi:hypothetical protein GDO81_027890 [Engystomops pustulosus]|uniref:Uncharacterized protein n=1 Tax=Engystomops pustulosus TaxID=76066 RepID=A0AAV6ZLD5_ENGPU|nr:hypothetical protein GDO81_027890 [Engystomops pustulosus]